MKQEYAPAIGWKIFCYILFGGFAVAMGYCFVKSIVTGEQIGLFAALFAGSSAFFWYCILSFERTKVITTENSITYAGAFKTKELPFTEIKGYRMLKGDKGSKTLLILSNVTPKNNIKIGDPSYLRKGDELLGFIQGKFKDIDNEEYEDEVADIMHDASIGATEDERAQKLQRVTKTARLLNSVGLVITLWLFFYPQPYPLPVYIALIYPFLAVAFFARNRELVTLTGEDKRKSAYPSLSLAFVFPPLGLLIRMLIDYDLLDFSKVLVPSAVVALVLFAGLFVLVRQSRSRGLDTLGAVIFALVYAYGSVVSVNCLQDGTKADLYHAKVLDRRISSGKSTSYYLSLTAWGTKQSGEEVTVDRNMYDQVYKGDTVTVNIKKGTLNIPWYYITK